VKNATGAEVEHYLAKVGVASSGVISRSTPPLESYVDWNVGPTLVEVICLPIPPWYPAIRDDLEHAAELADVNGDMAAARPLAEELRNTVDAVALVAAPVEVWQHSSTLT
jgi:hypothetical protein